MRPQQSVSVLQREKRIKELGELFFQLSADEQLIARSLYQLLAKGRPVEPETLSQHSGVTLSTIVNALNKWPGVFRNDDGAVIGFWGLAITPVSTHQFVVADTTLYAGARGTHCSCPPLSAKHVKSSPNANRRENRSVSKCHPVVSSTRLRRQSTCHLSCQTRPISIKTSSQTFVIWFTFSVIGLRPMSGHKTRKAFSSSISRIPLRQRVTRLISSFSACLWQIDDFATRARRPVNRATHKLV